MFKISHGYTGNSSLIWATESEAWGRKRKEKRPMGKKNERESWLWLRGSVFSMQEDLGSISSTEKQNCCKAEGIAQW